MSTVDKIKKPEGTVTMKRSGVTMYVEEKDVAFQMKNGFLPVDEKGEIIKEEAPKRGIDDLLKPELEKVADLLGLEHEGMKVNELKELLNQEDNVEAASLMAGAL